MMHMMKRSSALILLALACAVAQEPLGRGFGDGFKWKKFEEGIAEAKETGKPALVVIHKSWCGACKQLGPKFAESKDLLEESQNFVMINVHDDEEPKGEEWAPDGGYIPRVLFYDGSKGEVMKDQIFEGGNPKYQYFYSDPGSIIATMKRVKAKFSGSKSQEL